jgi:hypothetical protein
MYRIIVKPLDNDKPARTWPISGREDGKHPSKPPILDPLLQKALDVRKEAGNRNAIITIVDRDYNHLVVIDQRGVITRTDEHTGERRRLYV